MKILVTGGAGFIGSHIVEHYQDKAEEIRVLDNLRTGYLKNLEGLRHTFIEGSICDRELVRQAVQGVDYIFHMAALVSVPESMSKISECIDINVNGLLNVLEEASAAGVKKIVLASSAAIYGDNPTVPKLETMYPEPEESLCHYQAGWGILPQHVPGGRKNQYGSRALLQCLRPPAGPQGRLCRGRAHFH